jgi:hypothetical protein
VVLDVLFIVMLSGTALYTFVDVARSFRSRVRRGDRTIPGPLARVRIPPYIDLPRVQLDQVSVPLLAYLGFVLGMASGLMASAAASCCSRSCCTASGCPCGTPPARASCCYS